MKNLSGNLKDQNLAGNKVFDPKGYRIYAGTFITAFATLVIEITFSRLLSVISFYHLAFFAVSTAMLGMTAGAVTVYLKPQLFVPGNLFRNLSSTAIYFALSVPVSVMILCLIPLSLEISFMKLMAFTFIAIACSLPFYFSGIIISVVLTKTELPVGKVYASDLIGASAGCIAVLFGLELIDAPSLLLAAGAIVSVTAIIFGRFRKVYLLTLILLLLLASYNLFTYNGIRPVTVKGRMEDPDQIEYEKWNSFSRVLMYKEALQSPALWGPSPGMEFDPVQLHLLNIDGEAGTVMLKFSEMKDIDALKYDVTNMVHYLRTGGDACVIGVGGGRDMLSAILFGHKTVTGIELNPVFVNLLKGPYKDFIRLEGREGVKIINDEARSYLTGHDEKYDVLQMSLIDTWASTGAGAFSLSENSLYTMEAWKVFFNRLNDNGIFTVSRWFNPSNLGETGRIVNLAVSMLHKEGIRDASKHIMLIVTNNVSTLLLSKKEFTAEETEIIKNKAAELRFKLELAPGISSESIILNNIISSADDEQTEKLITNEPLNYTPPTDDNPYFFNMLKLGHLDKIKKFENGIIRGNLIASVTLVTLIVILAFLSILTIVVPLYLKRKETGVNMRKKGFSAGAFYFSLIGCGFMLVEISLIQKLSVFLGHPVYALGVLLFTIILSCGIGSYASSNMKLSKFYLFPIIATAAILIIKFSISAIIASQINAQLGTKIAVSIAIISPMGFILGFFFPTGIRLATAAGINDTSWYWALNGVFGVLCSALAIFISIYAGIPYNFYAGAVCYLSLIFFIKKLQNTKAEISTH